MDQGEPASVVAAAGPDNGRLGDLPSPAGVPTLRWRVTSDEPDPTGGTSITVALEPPAEMEPPVEAGNDPVGVAVAVDGSSVELRWSRWDPSRGRLWLPAGAADGSGAEGAGGPSGEMESAFGAPVEVLLGPAEVTSSGGLRREVVVAGWRFVLRVEPEARAALRERARRRGGQAAGAGPLEVRASIPGRVVALRTIPGETVDAGGTVLVVEAMKMQNEVRAPRAGRVAAIAVAPGSTVEMGDLLFVLE
jgi:biotin carboxyl carrier protein